ncbi:MAG: AI-2E family transporter [Candidatus Woesearchaeota archaeon]
MAEKRLGYSKQSKYILGVLFLGLIVISFFLIKKYIIALIGAIILTFLFYPIYKFIVRYLKNKTISSLITSILILLIMTIPLIFIFNSLLNESVKFFYNAPQINLGVFADKISRYLGGTLDVNAYLKDLMNRLSVYVIQKTSNFLFSIPQLILSLFVMFFTIYYLFKDGEYISNKILSALSLKENHKIKLYKNFGDTIYAVLYGVVLTAIVQGAIGTIGLWYFKVSSPITWGIVMTVLSMIPFLGAYFIWLPAAIIKISNGDFYNGFGLFLYGLIIVSTIDNVIRPKLIGRKANIHPILVLIGIIGGLQVFGLIGMVVGPLILSILMLFIETYLSEKNEAKG